MRIPTRLLKAAVSLAVLTLFAFSVPASADDGNIGIFSDMAATSTSIDIPCGESETLYIYALLEGASAAGITGAEYSIEVTGAGGLTFIEVPNPTATTVLGSALPPGNGVNIAWPSCQTGDGTKLLLATVIVLNIGCMDGETTLQVVQHTSPSNVFFRCPLFTLCDGPVFTKVCLGSDIVDCQTQVPPFPIASKCSTSGELVVNPEVMELSLDLNPTSCPNPLNVKKKGVIPAAILGSEVFDVNEVDVTTLLLEGIAPLRSSIDDVAAPADGEECECTTDGPDGIMDLTLKFPAPEVIEALLPLYNLEERPLTLTGNLLDGTPIEATDCVIIRGGMDEQIAIAPGADPDGDGEEGSATDTPGPVGIFSQGAPHETNRTVAYQLPEAGQVRLSVYDVTGRVVRRLVNRGDSSGLHTVTWDASGLPSGIYFYRLEAGAQAVSRKFVLVR